MSRRWDGLLWVVLGVCVGCSSTSRIDDHPEYSKIQKELEPVIEMVRNTSGQELVPHLQRLVAYDVFAVEHVTELADDPNPRLRSNALWVLAQVKDSQYPNIRNRIDGMLWDGLEDDDPMVRLEAATGLLDRDHWETIPVLLEGLDNENPQIRMGCHRTLRRVTNENFGFMADATEADRTAAVQRWRLWFEAWEDANG